MLRTLVQDLRLRRLGVRLALAFAALLLLFIAVLAVNGRETLALAGLNQKFASSDIPRLLRVQALSQSTEGLSSALLHLLTATREKRVPEYGLVDEQNRLIDRLVAELARDLRAVGDSPQAQSLARLVQARATYQSVFIALVDKVEAEDPAAAQQVYADLAQPALKALLAESNTLLLQERARVELLQAQGQARFERATMAAGMLSALAVGVAVWLAWRTTRSVVRPLMQVEQAALRIAAGDYSHPVPAISAEEVDRVGYALNTMAEAIASRERDIEKLAFRDNLTGLPNRTLLVKQGDAIVNPQPCLVLMDIARLKTINETLGFETGDAVVCEVARRLDALMGQAELLGEAPVLARLSGGTFAVLCRNMDRPGADRLRVLIDEQMARSVVFSGHPVDMSLSFGAADAPSDGRRSFVTALLRNAEVALYAAKAAAITWVWYAEALEASRLTHLGLLSDLRMAVQASELQMWLQPKLALGTRQVVGAEALVRWVHPTRGFISPAEFVPFAERTGHIGLLTYWMLDTALATLACWTARCPQLSIAVNLSTHDIKNADLVRYLQSLLQKHGVAATRLRLEITESGLMSDPENTIAVLHSLRELGFHLSIDDFGTGYSSLAYLQRLPVDELKIDRSFVDGIDRLPGTQRLVKAVIDMGHGLGMTVTAEGVETEAERETITQLGCDVMQGYLYSRPLHGAPLQAWLDGLGLPDSGARG